MERGHCFMKAFRAGSVRSDMSATEWRDIALLTELIEILICRGAINIWPLTRPDTKLPYIKRQIA